MPLLSNKKKPEKEKEQNEKDTIKKQENEKIETKKEEKADISLIETKKPKERKKKSKEPEIPSFDIDKYLNNVSEYREAIEGDIYQIIRDVLAGKILINEKLLERLKQAYPEQPFGGEKPNGGGWNSITYAIIEILIASGRLYLKKSDN